MTPILCIYSWIVFCVAIFFIVFSQINEFFIRKNTKKTNHTHNSFVSILIPARNEEENIEACIVSLVNQDYNNYEIVVLDDNSTDNTYNILERLKKQYPNKINIIQGKPLEDGWKGKNFAMHQLTKEAKGEILICTDADTIHKQNMITFALNQLESSKSQMISGFVSQKIGTFGELITIPLMYLLTGIVIPSFLNKKLKSKFLSIAIGQFIVIEKTALEKSGGYEAIKNKISDDIYLARLVKSKGFATTFLNFQSIVSCRMYHNYSEASKGIGKNIADFFNGFNIIPIIILFFIFLLLPVPMGIVKLFTVGFSLELASCLIFFLMWTFITIDRKLPWYLPFLYPLIYMNLIIMAFISQRNAKLNKIQMWKGRPI